MNYFKKFKSFVVTDTYKRKTILSQTGLQSNSPSQKQTKIGPPSLIFFSKIHIRELKYRHNLVH